ncbi:MAG: heavy metal sensor histidine kinase [Chloroflexota bacterium]
MRVRLTLWYVSLLAGVLVVFAGFLHGSLDRRLRAEIDRSLQDQVARVLPPPEPLPDLPRDPPPRRFAVGLRRPPAVAGIATAVYEADGETVIFGDAWEDHPEMLAARLGLVGGGQDLRTITMSDGVTWRVLTVPLFRADGHVATVQAGRSEESRQTALRELLVLLIIGIPTTLLLAIAIGVFMASRALNPIVRISQTAAQIGALDLSRRLGMAERHDEVGLLAHTFDAMLDRLEAAFQRQRQFTADASHELRTPLALLISRADVALEHPRDLEAYRAALEAIRGDTRRMSQLLNDLLTLARADSGQVALHREPLDLSDLATAVVLSMSGLAATRRVRLAVEAVPGVVVDADQTRLTQLLLNLVDNGLKFTPPGGTVTVSVRRQNECARLEVMDTGVGIGNEHLHRIFERFYRVDPARSRADGGTGLGLSICRWIVEAHGGTISVVSTPSHGATFSVRLPLQAKTGSHISPGVRGRVAAS